MSDFKHYLQCECGWIAYMPHGNAFFVYETVCPRCGNRVPDRNYRARDPEWEVFVGRYVNKRTRELIWWNPLTWFCSERIMEKR